MEKISANRFSFRGKVSDKKDRQKDCGHVDIIDEAVQQKIKYISLKEAHEVNQELLTEYALTVDQLLEISGYSCAVAISTCYPLNKMPRNNHAVLVCCGPGHNGGDGLVCARHLKMFGYNPTLFYPRKPNKPLFNRLFKQCESLDIPVLSFFPSEPDLITDSYNFVVDGIFGIGFKGALKQEIGSVIETLKHTGLPICSIDIPSGWDVETGDENGLKPDLLISLAVPKICAKLFKGKHHFIGGRFVPKTLEQKYDLNLPIYSGNDCIAEIDNVENNTQNNDNFKVEH